MSLGRKQENIQQSGIGNRVTLGNDNSSNLYIIPAKGKLATLFERLKDKFDNKEEISKISEDLKRYTDLQDVIGLEKKLEDANMQHYVDDFLWYKQEFNKKLILYQNYEPAQEIFSYILAIVLERYRNIIKPMIINGASESEILLTISNAIVTPLLDLVQQEGCNDIMGLSATEINGMFHYLTGQCHIKWKL
jgi:hypothetical protein